MTRASTSSSCFQDGGSPKNSQHGRQTKAGDSPGNWRLGKGLLSRMGHTNRVERHWLSTVWRGLWSTHGRVDGRWEYVESQWDTPNMGPVGSVTWRQKKKKWLLFKEEKPRRARKAMLTGSRQRRTNAHTCHGAKSSMARWCAGWVSATALHGKEGLFAEASSVSAARTGQVATEAAGQGQAAVAWTCQYGETIYCCITVKGWVECKDFEKRTHST